MMETFWFVFCKTDVLLLRLPDGTYSIPQGEASPVAVQPWTAVRRVTMADGTVVRALRIDAPVVGDERYEMCPLRASYYKLPHRLYLMAGKCQEILYWDQNTQYCGVCGGPMQLHTDISKRCTHCGKEVWPQLATAVIMLIRRGDEILMTRAHNFRGDFYGLVAGFVETGETLEEAACREALEETGIRIGNLRYFDSQPWPYPCGLMVGFTADYLSGQLHVQHTELSTAGWFHRDCLPKLPEKLSIARRLIDHWLSQDA